MSTPDDDRLADLLGSLTADDAARSEPPDDLWAGIAARVAASDAARDDPPVVLSTRRGRGRGGAASERRRSARSSSPRTARLAWAAAAVVLAGVAGLVWAVVDSSPSESPVGERLLAAAQLEQLEPLGSTRASARLVDEGGRRHLVIAASDMPAPPEGSDYELWLIDAGVSDPRSLGTVSGSEDVVVPSTIDTDEHPIVDISIEPRDGNHQHSGHSIMRGTLR